MRLWRWLLALVVLRPPVTPPEEHAEAERRARELQRRAAELEHSLRPYQARRDAGRLRRQREEE